MTTYTSTNSRPCAECGLRVCPRGCGSLGLLTSVLPASAIISQDVAAKQYLNDNVPVIELAQDPRDYVTMTGVLEALDKGPQEHAGRSGRAAGWRLLSMLALFLGTVLMAIGWVFNDATVQLVWSILHGEGAS